ncbi:hypothetical protein MPSEU_000156900 [Mayamaea pseudoterrestris]|nr:hypothetical protein MPSEU_000156900 [Mayamaea pseudoterrestris]
MSFNYRGGSGNSGGRSSSNYRGGGGRSSGGRGGRHSGGRGGAPGSNNNATVLPCKFRPCKSWIQSGACSNARCSFAHVVQLHANIEASAHVNADGSVANDGKQQQHSSSFQHTNGSTKPAAVTSIAIWEANGALKIFTGSLDGYWRLWSTGDWRKEFESSAGTKVERLLCSNNTHLICGMEAISRALPACPVGMCHVWNLSQPDRPPMELHLDGNAAAPNGAPAPSLLPYAHNLAVTAICLHDTTLITGSRDGCIRIWKFVNNAAFVLDKTLFGQAREVTGLVVVGGASAAGAAAPAAPALLWSSSLDGSIRIWDLQSGDCRYSITSAPPLQQPSQPVGQPAAAGPGHADAVTCLERFETPSGVFILSASLDGTIKAWNGATGECVASEQHGEGVVTIAIAKDQTNTEVLLVGLLSGNIVCRNLVQTPKAAAFEALFCLTTKFNAGHSEAVRCITPGPQATFYSGGNDGRLMVWQINGDLQLK